MMGLGGRGWQAGLYHDNFRAMEGAIGEGYAALAIDGGILLSKTHLDG